MMILVSVLVLGVLIFVHELGHFLIAKLFKVGVLEFSIGFGKKLLRFKRGETTYSIGAIPLGGYVRMVGDDYRSLRDEVAAAAEGETPEEHEANELLDPSTQALLQDRSRWFLLKPLHAKAAIVLAGPAFNIIFALLLAVFSVATFGRVTAVDEPIIGEAIPDFPAHKAGLQRNDRVLAVNGQVVESWREMAKLISNSQDGKVSLTVERATADGGALEQSTIEVQGTTQDLLPTLEEPQVKQFRIGIVPSTHREPVGLVEALKLGTAQVYFISYTTVRGLYGMVVGAISPSSIRGPIFIFGEAARSADRGSDYLIDFMVFLSVSLAVLNLLPIPVLDGGHLLFFLIEAVRRRPLSLRVQEYATQVGMVVLLLLMVFALGNDILSFIH